MSTLRVTTLGMAYGPHAVARAEGKVLFVRGAAPGEDLDVAVREDRGRFAFADIVTVVRPGPGRRETPCPYLPRCGGCPWQHLRYEAQLDFKRDLVAQQLARIAGLRLPVSPVLPSPAEFGYRRRLKLRVEGGDLGFYAGASHVLVPIESCLLAEPPINAAIPAVRELVRRLATRLRRAEIAARGSGETGVVVSGEAEGPWGEGDEEACARWLDTHPDVRGLRLAGRGWQRTWGDTRIQVEPEDGLVLSVRAHTFTQVNPGANRLLVETVRRLVDPHPGLAVLELHAGAGNLSLPLARRGARVLAVEADRHASQDGADNARRLGVESYTTRCQTARQALGSLPHRGQFEVALLDPPRSGARDLLAALLRLAPARIVYVSCDPATLARDLGVLKARYAVDAVQPIDMFPHGYHVETVVRARLAS